MIFWQIRAFISWQISKLNQLEHLLVLFPEEYIHVILLVVDFAGCDVHKHMVYKTNSFGASLWWMWCTRQIGCYMYWAACDMCLCIFVWHVDTIWALNIVLICAKNCIFSILNCSVEQSVAVNVWSVGWSDGECVVTDYLSLKSGNRLSVAVNIHCNRLSVAKSIIWR